MGHRRQDVASGRVIVMKMKYGIIFAVSALAALIFTPLKIAASPHGSGFGMHSLHFPNHFRPAIRNRAFNQFPFYGGLYALPTYGYGNMGSYAVDNSASPPAIIYVAEPPQALGCTKSQQTKTVPAEGGGTRDITITRC
jgi:hypothetical protein